MNREEAKRFKQGETLPDDPIFFAVSDNHLDKIQELIKTGEGDVNCVTGFYRKGLQCYVKSHDAFSILAESGLIIDERTLTTFIQHGLHNELDESSFACEILDRLIDYGAPIDGSTDKREIEELYQYQANRSAPLVNCIFDDRPKFFEVLLKRGANPSIKDIGGTTGLTPLHWVVIRWGRGDWRNEFTFNNPIIFADLLILFRADLRSPDYYGDSPIHMAARYHWHVPFEYLIRKGECLFIANGSGLTPFQVSTAGAGGQFGFPKGVFDVFKRNYDLLLKELYCVNSETGELARAK